MGYLKVDGGTARIDMKRLQADQRFHGKWILRPTTGLPPEHVALACRGLWRVERAFRTLKTPIEIRPIHHHSEPGVRGHVRTCVLAYLLTCIISYRLARAGIDQNAQEALEALDSIHATR